MEDRVPEGTVGGHWGLYDQERREKFPWTGPVAEAPQGRTIVFAALAAALLGGGLGFARGGAARLRAAAVFASAAALLVGIGAYQWHDLRLNNATAVDWAATLVIGAAGWTTFALAVRALLGGSQGRDPIPQLLLLLLLLGCAYICLGLVFAGRHRDFPFWLFIPGVMGIALTSSATHRLERALDLVRRRATGEVLLATWLVVAGVLIPLSERFANTQSLLWGLSSLVFGSAILLPLALQAREHHGAAEHADPGPGEAVEHHADGADRDGQRGRGR